MVLTSSAPLYSSLHGLLTIVIVAVASFDKVCDAFSIPRLPLSLQSHHHIRGWVNNDGDGNGNGGGGNIRGIHVHNYYEEDDSGDSSDGVAFNLASLSWISAQSDPHENDNDIPDGVSNDMDIEHYQHHEVSPTKNLRGGGVSTKSNNSREKSTSSSIINDSLDSIQTILFQPIRVLSKRLPTNPWKKKDDDEETKKLKQKEEELLSTTKVQSVSAPDSELLPPDYITECAKESNLIGGTLTPETLDLTAKRINRLYLENGYIMNSVTGATLVPPSNGKDDNEEGGHVELKVTEVKVAKHASPVHIRIVEKINIEDAADDDESVRSLPSQPFHQTNSDSQTTTIKEVSGRTRPSKIASIVKLKPGSHFRIIPELWSELAASGPGGINQRRRGNSPALFSTIHAVRPIPTSDGANTVDVEVIATENKPYLSVEYGVTKSLYSDKWEGELDMKHSNAFGGGEVATVNVRKGRGTSSGQKEEESGIVRSVSGGPLSWRFSIKDEYLAGSDAGYDLEVLRDHVGVSGHERISSKGLELNENEEQPNDECSPLRTGATMRLRLPRTRLSFLPKTISTKLERVDPFSENDSAQCIASMSTDIGPYHHNWKVFSRPIRSTFTAIGTAGGRWNAKNKTGESNDKDASTLQYATGTITSQQTMPLCSESSRSVPPVDLAIRHVISASTRHLPRHEAILLGLSSARIRGYKYNYQQPSVIHRPEKGKEAEEKSMMQVLKQFVQGSSEYQFRPPIAISKAITGTMEVRIPFNRVVKESVFGSGTFVLFGDWCLAQAQPSVSSEEPPELCRHASMGIGLRKVVQGLPLKMDACVTEHGTKGIFFGIGA